jgi:multidrug efflux pump subunit AcrA (membrane-fusion protein)
MTAEATIILQSQTNILTVPVGALLKGDGQPYVFMVDSAGTIQKVPVVLGIKGPDRIEIVEGLAENQSVIVSGQENYHAGQVVHPVLSTITMPKQEDEQ